MARKSVANIACDVFDFRNKIAPDNGAFEFHQLLNWIRSLKLCGRKCGKRNRYVGKAVRFLRDNARDVRADSESSRGAVVLAVLLEDIGISDTWQA